MRVCPSEEGERKRERERYGAVRRARVCVYALATFPLYPAFAPFPLCFHSLPSPLSPPLPTPPHLPPFHLSPHFTLILLPAIPASLSLPPPSPLPTTSMGSSFTPTCSSTG